MCTGINSLVTQLCLNSQKLIVLGETFTSISICKDLTGDVPATGGASLDLATPEADDEIGDEGIFGFTGTMGDHDAPTGIEGVCGGLKGFANGSDLIDFEEEGVTGLLFDGSFDTDGVCDSEIVSDDLVLVLTSKVCPCLPIILIEWIFNTIHQLHIPGEEGT